MDAEPTHELVALAREIAASEGRTFAAALPLARACLMELLDTAATWERARVAAWADLMAYAARYEAQRGEIAPLRLARPAAGPPICAVAPGAVRFGALILDSQHARRIALALLVAADAADAAE